MTKLLFLGNKIQLIGMSATMPNVKQVADWLQASLYISDYRPVPLTDTAEPLSILENSLSIFG